MNIRDTLRSMPRVDELTAYIKTKPQAHSVAYSVVLSCVREKLDAVRQGILCGAISAIPDKNTLASEILDGLKFKSAYSLRPVINATGIVLHTNLGRAVLAEEVAEHVKEVAMEYSTLEYSVKDGARGNRHAHMDALLCEITGAESAIAVNNNAAAVLLALTTMCKGKEVVVSRGELVEIGGAFRVPEIMNLGGAILKEVGTTNKTKVFDYENAINENTAALLKVHTSNFKMIGFCESVEAEELARVAHAHGLPLVYDLGSGLLSDEVSTVIPDERMVKQCIRAGADVVCFSGDKLLGGPQAGIIVGKKEYISAMKQNPFARAVRIDKLTLAALEATLRLYSDGRAQTIPTVKNLTVSAEELKEKANALCARLAWSKGFSARVVKVNSQVGGGSAPGIDLTSYAVEIAPSEWSVDELEYKLRVSEIPIVVRIHKDKILLDCRTISEKRFADVERAFRAIFGEN